MAIGTPTLATPRVGATAATIDTASFTPTAGDLLIAKIAIRGAGATEPTFSDSIGSTWNAVPNTSVQNGAARTRCFKQIAAATARVCTAVTTGNTQIGIEIYAIPGADVHATNVVADGTNSTGDPSVTMGAFGGSSACIGFTSVNAGSGITTYPSGYTEFAGSNIAIATNTRISTCYDLTSPGTAMAWVGGGTDAIGIGIELIEAAAGVTLVAAAGSYAISGADASFLIDYLVVANAGSYTISGSDANLAYARTVVAEAGSYALTGTAAVLKIGLSLIAEGGDYAITGSDVEFLHNRKLAAEAGSYLVSGTPANLEKSRFITAEGGAYAITGAAVSLEIGSVVLALAGSYSITGSQANLARSHLFTTLNAGSYTISGQSVGLSTNSSKLIIAEQGTYVITGSDNLFHYAQLGNFESLRDPLFSPLFDPLRLAFERERYN